MAALPGIRVIGESELRLLLAHRKDIHDLGACHEEACLANIAEAAGVEELVTGHIGRFGKGYFVVLSRSHAGAAHVDRRESCHAEAEAGIRECLNSASAHLMGMEPERSTFSLSAKRRSFAIVDFAAYGIRKDLAENLTQLTAVELRTTLGQRVITRDEIGAMMRHETDRQVLSCELDIACIAEIGGALGVDYLVAGGVGMIAGAYAIHLKLIDVARAEVVHRVAELWRGPEPALIDALRFSLASLLARPQRGAGSIAIFTVGIEGSDTRSHEEPYAFQRDAIRACPLRKT